jgi:hypothetical protein
MSKERTVTGAYSEQIFGGKGAPDKIRNVEISPAGGMREIKNFASAIDSNSGRNAGFAAPIKPGAGTVVGKVDPHGSENQREVRGLEPKRSKPGARWERG